MPASTYANYESSSPALGAFHITPSDASNTTHTTRGIYVGGAGIAKVTMYTGEIVTLTGLLAGNYYPLAVTKVWSSDTTATLLIGLY